MKKDIAFVHINKTGGTSILKALDLPKEHLTAVEMRARYPDAWTDIFTFSFVRNPWDKVVSHYHYRVKTNQTELQINPIPFREWVIKSYSEQDPFFYDNVRMFMPQVNWLRDDTGAIIVDYIGKFETIDHDFSIICNKLNISTQPLPHINGSDHLHYSHYYDEDTKAIIGEWFKDDIAQFNYSFKPEGT